MTRTTENLCLTALEAGKSKIKLLGEFLVYRCFPAYGVIILQMEEKEYESALTNVVVLQLPS